MRIEINIIPDAEKKERKMERNIGFILRMSFSVFFALAVLSGVLFFAQFALDADYSTAKADSQIHRQNLSKGSDDIESLLTNTSKLAKKIKQTSEETPRWSKVILKLTELAPSEIKLTSVNVEKEHIKIGGFSKTREAFLDFRKKLEENGYKNMKSPVSNLVSPTDFNFAVEADFDKAYLSQL